MGVTLMPQLGLTAVHPGVAVRSVGRHAPVRHIWAARLREAYESPATAAMVQMLVDIAEDFRPEISGVPDPEIAVA
jgi:hypothetical protein